MDRAYKIAILFVTSSTLFTLVDVESLQKVVFIEERKKSLMYKNKDILQLRDRVTLFLLNVDLFAC